MNEDSLSPEDARHEVELLSKHTPEELARMLVQSRRALQSNERDRAAAQAAPSDTQAQPQPEERPQEHPEPEHAEHAEHTAPSRQKTAKHATSR